MIIDKNNKNRKKFIEQSIGNRKYFSYRADLMICKILLCVIIYLIIYIITSEFGISISISLQIMLILTFINKLRLERKEKEGRKILLDKVKYEYAEKKINSMDMKEFEKFIQFYFEKNGYNNYKKISKSICSVLKCDEKYCITLFRFYGESDVEKVDLRALVTVMHEEHVIKGFVVTMNKISEEADKFLETARKNLEIEIIDMKVLVDFLLDKKMLPDEEFFYRKIEDDDAKSDINLIESLKNDILSLKKRVIYIFAALFFYILSFTIPSNNLLLYISYYFVMLTIVSTVCTIIIKIYKNKVSDAN